MAESDINSDELPLDSAGLRLRRARDAAKLSLGDVSARTKIAERHLSSIEESRFGDLASRTYAVGFARAYARAVGLDEAAIAQAVRDELTASDNARQAPQIDVFEPGDPARVPGSRLAWIAALFAVAVIAFVFVYWRSFFSPAATLPDLTAPAATASATATVPAPASAAPAVPVGQTVVFTALEPNIWVKFADAQGAQLLQKQMAQGESFTVPADAVGPVIRTARPDALQISIGGKIVPRLADKPVNISNAPVTAAALLARATPTPPAAAAKVAAGPAVSATAVATPVPVAAAPSPRPRPATKAPAAVASSPSPPASPSPAAPAAAAPIPAPAAAPLAEPQTSTTAN